MRIRNTIESDLLVLGTGIAGCTVALCAAQQGCRVIMVTRDKATHTSSTELAQGGIIYKGRRDSVRSLVRDVLEAGDNVGDPRAVRMLAENGPRCVERILIDMVAVPFDRDARGHLDLTLEGAHTLPRIIHCTDSTGREIAHALWRAVSAHPNITILERTTVIDLLTTSHHSLSAVDIYKPTECIGAYVLRQRPHRIFEILAKETVLATGGAGQVFLHTTNGSSARGDGYAMAQRAGARLANMEYVQFHPTTLFRPNDENFLISESLRGEGAELRDRTGRAFTRDYDPRGSLAPRDIVARAIHHEMLKQHAPCMYLDISHKDSAWIRQRFPMIYERCLQYGIDITREPIPIVPSAHYQCGGVVVDGVARTSIPRLRAVGEVSCTGVHGANRLASTSLLEALVWGVSCAEDCVRSVHETRRYYFPRVAPWKEEREYADQALLEQDWMIIKHTMWNYVGLVRSARRLRRAQRLLGELQTEVETFYRAAALTDQVIGLRNGLQTALTIMYAAIRNRTSRGCHFRLDDD
jgi:L-aspartate oxidase